MANLDLSGFENKPQQFSGLTQGAEIVERQRLRDDRLAQDREGRQAATSKFLTNYLDPKDHLTGTNYDPQIVGGFQNVLQQAQQLASKGASTNDILMAIGPSVSKLNQYSVTAKQINDNIKSQAQKLKPYAGYNLEALESEAKKAAFYGPDGKLKDISSVDPNENYISMVAQNNPELITTGKGLDDFVNKTPMADYSRNATTSYGGRSRNVKYEAKHPFWEDLKTDDKGNIQTDAVGNPVGLGVVGSSMLDDNGKPIANTSTGQPFQVMDKGNFNSVMQHNPDVADYIRGQVNKHFRDAGAKQLPAEGSAQWDMMARHLLHDELETRSRSTFRTVDQQKQTLPSIKVDIGNNPEMLEATSKYQEASRLKGDYSIYDPKTEKNVKTNAVQTVGEIFNNNPTFLQGEQDDVNGRSVVDVTQFFPGGGLKTGRGSDENYKTIWYDPAKRSLLVSVEGKRKDASGSRPSDIEEIPESKAGLFMSRIAASNGVDVNKVRGILDQAGYKGAKFTNVANPDETSKRISEEHSSKVNSAISDNRFAELKGIQTKDGVISEVSERSNTSWLPGVDKYAVYVKDKDGKTKKAFTTSDKDELEAYIKGTAKKEEQKKTSNGPKKSESLLMDILKNPSTTDDLRSKYDY